METILLMTYTGILNIVCFYIGAKVGQKVVKNQELKLPTVNPIQIMQEHEEKREVAKEMEDLETMLRNVDNYDGTSLGQEKIK